MWGRPVVQSVMLKRPEMEESHHYHAMELPGPETVRADFNNTEFINYGVTTKFFMEGDKFMVETNNQKGDGGF